MKYGLVDEEIQPVDRLLDRIGDAVELEIYTPPTEDELIESLRDKDIIFTTSRLTVSRRVLEETDLAVVAKLGTGIDNVDLDAAAERGIPVTHTPGANALGVAEHALCLLLMLSGRVLHGRDALNAGAWRDELETGSMLSKKTIGIVGYGDIGSRLATLLNGFHVEILVHDPYIASFDTDHTGATLTSLETVLAKSDAVSVNAELTDETHHLLGEPELARMKESAFLVNTSRGALIDEVALVDALRAGKIAGAGLDVFEEEPLPLDSPLRELDNVILTPHIAGTKNETRQLTIDLIAENALALLAGNSVPPRYMAT